MFWIAIIVFALAAGLIKLGAIYVIVGVLKLALHASAAIIALLVAILVWRNFFRSRN